MGKRHFACNTDELAHGNRKLIRIGTRSIGLFNVNGNYHALLNLCPHTGGTLCEGPVGGINLPVDLNKDGYRYQQVRKGEILRCAWHGWEFEIATGRCLVDPKLKAKTYAVEVEDGKVFVIV